MVVRRAGLIDVFAESPLSGNPLAVVEDADALEEQQMRRIAGEFAQAETTFVSQSERADFKLRSFTASGVEVFGAGHNALGAWLWLGYHDCLGPLDTPRVFQQEIGGVLLPITMHRQGERIYGRMKQSPVKLLPPLKATDLLAEALGLASNDLLSHPVTRGVDTGAAHLMVRLRSNETVDRVAPKVDKLSTVLEGSACEGCYVYSFDIVMPRRAYARFFNPAVGLWEDAATGTAAGPLAAYLGQQGLLADDRSLTIEQGTKMGRQSFLPVRLDPDPELSGSGVIVLSGSLNL